MCTDIWIFFLFWIQLRIAVSNNNNNKNNTLKGNINYKSIFIKIMLGLCWDLVGWCCVWFKEKFSWGQVRKWHKQWSTDINCLPETQEQWVWWGVKTAEKKSHTWRTAFAYTTFILLPWFTWKPVCRSCVRFSSSCSWLNNYKWRAKIQRLPETTNFHILADEEHLKFTHKRFCGSYKACTVTPMELWSQRMAGRQKLMLKNTSCLI